jgi:hypothetical protein
MRWNGTNEDLSNAEIGFYFAFGFIKNILGKRKDKCIGNRFTQK